MKFGASLAQLCSSGWDCYKIDYNDLKHKILLLTKEKREYSLQLLYNDVNENIDYVSLFVQTKNTELMGRIKSQERIFDEITSDTDIPVLTKLMYYDEILFALLDITSELNDFLKFVILQKVALRKILKKLQKYYKDRDRSERFAQKIKHNLSKESKSFVNYNFSSLTLKLTLLINRVKAAPTKIKGLGSKQIGSEPKASSPQKLTDSMKFDLNATLKTNFSLKCLILDDAAKINGLSINLNIYLGLKNCNPNERPELISYIYLMDENMLAEPTYIISKENSCSSLIITHVGGLRNYAYCQLPNNLVLLFIKFLKDRSDSSIIKKIFDFDSRNLTKFTIENIVKKRLKAKLKYYCYRTRYSLEGSDNLEDATGFPVDRTDYLITLDHDIYTTNDLNFVESLSFDIQFKFLERFPFGIITIYSNDLNLSIFESNCTTELTNAKLDNKIKSTLIRKLPPKIQQLILINLFSVFKDFSLYHYMLSCYCNCIPDEKHLNSHFSKLLNLNLFKFMENIDEFNSIVDIENKLAHDQTTLVSNHHLSLKTLNDQLNDSLAAERKSIKPSLRSMNSNYSLLSIDTSTNVPSTRAPSTNAFEYTHLTDKALDFSTHFDVECDSLDLFLDQINLKEGILNNTIVALVKLWRGGNLFSGQDITIPSLNRVDESLNEDSSLLQNEAYYRFRNQFIQDYDKILTMIYATMSLLSIFLTGIELGVMATVFNLRNEATKLFIRENFWLFLILFINLFAAAWLGITSFALLNYRFNVTPWSHIISIATVNIIIMASFIWHIVLLSKEI